MPLVPGQTTFDDDDLDDDAGSLQRQLETWIGDNPFAAIMGACVLGLLAARIAL